MESNTIQNFLYLAALVVFAAGCRSFANRYVFKLGGIALLGALYLAGYFLTGDRHHSELSSYVNANGHAVYDLTVSPLTSGVAQTRGEVNDLQVEGTLVEARNFGLLSFSGPCTERQMLIQLFDEEGQELWQRTLMAPSK